MCVFQLHYLVDVILDVDEEDTLGALNLVMALFLVFVILRLWLETFSILH